MKKIAIGVMLICLAFDGLGQSFPKNQKRITRISKKLAKKAFIKTWKNAQDVWWVAAFLESYKMVYVPIPSFVLSKEAISYDSTKHIVDYLIPNKRHPLELVLLFRKNSDKLQEATFDGVVDCFDSVFHDDDTPCQYENSPENDNSVYDKFLKQGFEALSSRNYSFLFSVRHVRNCFWFIENNRVFLLDIKEKKVYDPDEYILLKCSTEIIRDLADGHGRICN